MKLVFERMKLVVEPSGAAGLAAVLSPTFDAAVAEVRNKLGTAAAANGNSSSQEKLNVGVILCGGNLDFDAKGFWQEDNWRPSG